MGDPKFKGIEFKVGLFIIIAMIMVIITVVTYAINSDLLTKKIKVIIYTNSGEGLKKGMPVIYSGFQISRIDSVLLEDSGRVKLTTGIPMRYTKWIKPDSEVKIVAQNFIGSSSIVFTGGSIKKDPIKTNQEFFLKRDKGIDELINKAKPVMDDVKEIVKNLRIITNDFADKNGNFNKLMTMIGQISSDISAKQTSLGLILRTNYITNHVDKLLKDIEITENKVNRLLNNVNKLTVKIDSRVAETKNTIPLVNDNLKLTKQLMSDIKLKLNDLNPILNDVKKITNDVAESTDDLKLLRHQMELMMDTTYELMLKTNNMWPFNSSDKGEEKLKLP